MVLESGFEKVLRMVLRSVLQRVLEGERVLIGWSRMSGRRTSGSSRPSLGVQVLAVFSFIS